MKQMEVMERALEEKKELMRQQFFHIMKNKILSVLNPNSRVELLTEEVLTMFIALDQQMHEGIEYIYLMPNFNGKNGYVLAINGDIPMNTALFDAFPEGIGICQASYDVIGGMPQVPNEDLVASMHDLLTDPINRGPGITTTDTQEGMEINVKDEALWGASFGENSWYSLAHNESDGTAKVFARTNAADSSAFIYAHMKQMIAEKPHMTFRMYLEEYAPLLKVHLKNAKRNTSRAVDTLARFMHVRFPYKLDEKAFIGDEFANQVPYLPIPDTYNFYNFPILYNGVDSDGYTAYVEAMKMNPEITKNLVPQDDPNKHCIFYFNETTPQEFFSAISGKQKHWRGVVSVNDGQQFAEITMRCTENACRFTGIPGSVSKMRDEEDEEEEENSSTVHLIKDRCLRKIPYAPVPISFHDVTGGGSDAHSTMRMFHTDVMVKP